MIDIVGTAAARSVPDLASYDTILAFLSGWAAATRGSPYGLPAKAVTKGVNFGRRLTSRFLAHGAMALEAGLNRGFSWHETRLINLW
jgi:hypothetical protein